MDDPYSETIMNIVHALNLAYEHRGSMNDREFQSLRMIARTVIAVDPLIESSITGFTP